MVFLIASVAPAGLVTIGLLLAATCRRRGCACFIQQGKNKYMFRKGTAEIVPASGVPSPNRFLEDEIELHGNRLDDENEIELHGNRLDDEAAIAGEGSGVQLGHVGAGEHGADSPDRSSGDETESLIDSIKPSDGSPPQLARPSTLERLECKVHRGFPLPHPASPSTKLETDSCVERETALDARRAWWGRHITLVESSMLL